MKKKEEEYINIGVNDKAKQNISSVFIDCKLRANRQQCIKIIAGIAVNSRVLFDFFVTCQE